MKIIVSPGNYNEAIKLLEKDVILLIGDHNHSVRSVYDCSLDEIKKLTTYQNKKAEIWININAFFFEPQILELEEYLTKVSQLKIDRVVFNDLAIAQINHEKNLNLNLHYDPVTLITSYGQFNFYTQNNFKSISLSNELFLPEINEIVNHKPKNLEIAIQVHGFVTIMHSRWNLVTNFQNYVNDINDEYTRQKILKIREDQRQYSNLIYEDQHGTHMFSGYELCLIKFLDKLQRIGIDYIKIDNILQSSESEYSLELTEIYQTAINLIETNDFDTLSETLYQKCERVGNQQHELSSGFIGGIKEIKHYEKL